VTQIFLVAGADNITIRYFPDPGNWNSINHIECVGCGGPGNAGTTSGDGGSGGGGGGGAWAVGENLSPVFPVPYFVGKSLWQSFPIPTNTVFNSDRPNVTSNQCVAAGNGMNPETGLGRYFGGPPGTTALPFGYPGGKGGYGISHAPNDDANPMRVGVGVGVPVGLTVPAVSELMEAQRVAQA
jgi:hypothetical protein